MARPYLVIGLGRFGSYIAQALSELGVDVIAVDRQAERVEEIKDKVRVAAVCRASDRDSLQRIVEDGVQMAIVAIIDHLESSILATLLLKELGCDNVVATARNAEHAKLLRMLGVRLVVNPEIEFSKRLARSLVSPALVDFQSIGKDHAIAELMVRDSWVGKSLAQLELRRKYQMNVIAVLRGGRSHDTVYELVQEKEEGTHELIIPEPDTQLEESDLLLVFSPIKELRALGVFAK